MKCIPLSFHRNTRRSAISLRVAGALFAVLSGMALRAQTPLQKTSLDTLGAQPAATIPAAPPRIHPPQHAHSSPRSQSIKVSGWWVIDIKTPDGKLVQHHEFENGIYTTGTQLLSYLLAGKAAGGEPMLDLTSKGTSACGASSFSNGCHLFSNPNGFWGNPCIDTTSACLTNSYALCPDNPSACSTTLAVTLVPQPNSGIEIQFTGQIAAPQNGTIDTVSSWFMVCSDVTPGQDVNSGVVIPPSPTSAITSANPNACYFPYQVTDGNTYPTYGASPLAFTGTSITPITVLAGQIINASVVFSFGSLN
jgi:hypothetical protein